MINTKVKISSLIFRNEDGLFYLACFLISFNTFPFSKFGLGADKSLSLIPVAIYFLQILFNGKLYFRKDIYRQMGMIFLLMAISLYLSLYKYYTLVGFNSAVGCWGAYFLYLGAFGTFMRRADDQKVFNMMKCIFFSLWWSLVFGILEYGLLQFHISSIKDLIVPFLRDSVFLESDRIQLNFGESGDAGQLLPGLFLPVIIYLKKCGYNFSLKEKGMLIINVLLLVLYAKSASFIIVGSFALLLYYDSYLKTIKIYIYIKPIVIISLLLASSVLLASIYSLADMEGPVGRVASLVVNPEYAFSQDLSTAARVGLWFVTFKIFSSLYVFGTGLGNFGLEYSNYYSKIQSYFLTPEMIGKVGQQVQQTYSIISTSYTEGGILGIVWLMMFLYPLFKMYRIYPKILPFVLVFLIISLQQMVIYVFAFVMIWLLFTEPKVCKVLQGKNE